MNKKIVLSTYNATHSKYTFNDFIYDLEHSIMKYENNLKHTINGKKEYVFKEYEFVGESKLKFTAQAQEVIKENQEPYKQFVISLNIKFPNISIVESSNTLFHYKLRGENSVSKHRNIN